MRFKMIGFVGASLLLLAGCDGKSPLAQTDNSCVQKPVCATPAQPAPPSATTPADYSPPAPRRAVRYGGARRWAYSRRSGSYASTAYTGGVRYEGETKDYGQVYSTGDTRYAGTRVQVQTSDSYTASGGSSTTYSSYGGGYAGGYSASYSSGGGVIVVDGDPAGCPGACGPARPRAAGRDRQGYLTWPSK